MVETAPDGMRSGYHRPVLFVWLFPVFFVLIGGASDPLNASLPAGSLSTVIGGVVVALGVILVAVGLASAAFLALLAGQVDGL